VAEGEAVVDYRVHEFDNEVVECRARSLDGHNWRTIREQLNRRGRSYIDKQCSNCNVLKTQVIFPDGHVQSFLDYSEAGDYLAEKGTGRVDHRDINKEWVRRKLNGRS
jgi:hypothetical protein